VGRWSWVVGRGGVSMKEIYNKIDEIRKMREDIKLSIVDKDNKFIQASKIKSALSELQITAFYLDMLRVEINKTYDVIKSADQGVLDVIIERS